MSNEFIPITHARGMGRLPQLLEHTAGYAKVEQVFSDSKLPLSLVDHPNSKIPLGSMIQLFEKAGQASDDRCFGLRVGSDMGHRGYGIISDYASQAPTLFKALQRLQFAIKAHQPASVFTLKRNGANWIWTYHHPMILVSEARYHVDHILPAMISMIRSYLGQSWLPKRICVPYEDDGRSAELRDVFASDWLFSRSGISFEIPADQIQTGRLTDVEPKAYVTGCEILAAIASTECKSPVEAIEALIHLRLLEDTPDVETVAILAGMSTRTLQRTLHESGTTFRVALLSARMHRAVKLINETELTLTEISLILGYNDPGNFSRAFQKYHGIYPSALRREADRTLESLI